MRLLVLCLAGLLIAGCATPPDSKGISRVGLIERLPSEANYTYIGVTAFHNESEDVAIDWSFPHSVLRELQSQMADNGREAVDITDLPEIEARREGLFHYGYSLAFGLAKHRIDEPTAKVFSAIMAQHNLDVILVLRPAAGNQDIEYGELPPEGGFGVYRRSKLLHKDRAYTYVQFVVSVVGGSPPAVMYQEGGSNMFRQLYPGNNTDFGHAKFRAEIEQQIAQAVRDVLDELGF